MDCEREQNWSHGESQIGVLSLFPAVCTNVHTQILLWSKYSGLPASSCSFTSLTPVHWHKYFYLSPIIYLYHSNSLSNLSFPLPDSFLAQENCAFLYYFSWYVSNYFPSALIFLKLNEGRWRLHLPVLEGVSNPLNLSGEMELRV